MLVFGLANERQPPARVERRIVQRVGAERDAGDGDDADPLVPPADELARRGVAEPVPAPGLLQPQPETLAQNSSSLRAASTTRSTEGMYASSICQYGYGTS